MFFCFVRFPLWVKLVVSVTRRKKSPLVFFGVFCDKDARVCSATPRAACASGNMRVYVGGFPNILTAFLMPYYGCAQRQHYGNRTKNSARNRYELILIRASGRFCSCWVFLHFSSPSAHISHTCFVLKRQKLPKRNKKRANNDDDDVKITLSVKTLFF